MRLRAFVALDILDDRVLDSLVSFQNELVSTGADLKVVERQNLHFTVRFLGEISESQAKEADRRLRDLRLEGGPVTVSGVGVFPNPSRPRVVWVGVGKEDEARIRPVAESIIAELEGIGERDTRPFQAHVTLARVHSGRNMMELASLLGENSGRSFGAIRLAKFSLKSSRLTPAGPVYSDLGVYPLS